MTDEQLQSQTVKFRRSDAYHVLAVVSFFGIGAVLSVEVAERMPQEILFVAFAPVIGLGAGLVVSMFFIGLRDKAKAEELNDE